MERAGVNATQLRVRRKTIELKETTARWPNFAWPQSRTEAVSVGNSNTASAQSPTSLTDPPVASNAGWSFLAALSARVADLADTAFQFMVSVVRAAAELTTIVFLWALLAVADHGLRPAKVVWWMLGVLLIFWWFVRYRLKIVAFEPKSDADQKPAPADLTGLQSSSAAPNFWPISLLFLFDRLIPVYKIREEHYTIKQFYRKASGKEIATVLPDRPIYHVAYLRKKHPVLPASDVERVRLEKWLVVLRVIGVGFTVFLLAAINALTAP